MDFEGKVLQILQPTKGTSSRGEWQRQEVIFEMTQEFSRKVAVTFFNKPADVEKLRVGESYIVSVNIESREYNGRWYTDVREWRIQPLQQQAAAPAAELSPLGEESSYTRSDAPIDDMPF